MKYNRAQYVPQLGQFVKPVLAQPAPEFGDTRIVFARNTRNTIFLCMIYHTAELIDAKCDTVQTNTLLCIQYRAFG